MYPARESFSRRRRDPSSICVCASGVHVSLTASAPPRRRPFLHGPCRPTTPTPTGHVPPRATIVFLLVRRWLVVRRGGAGARDASSRWGGRGNRVRPDRVSSSSPCLLSSSSTNLPELTSLLAHSPSVRYQVSATLTLALSQLAELTSSRSASPHVQSSALPRPLLPPCRPPSAPPPPNSSSPIQNLSDLNSRRRSASLSTPSHRSARPSTPLSTHLACSVTPHG